MLPEPKDQKSGQVQKLFDIAKPGKLLPSASSRPLIVGHRTLLKDPMIKAALPDKVPDQESSQKLDQDRPPTAETTPKEFSPVEPTSAAETSTSEKSADADGTALTPVTAAKPSPETTQKGHSDDQNVDALIQQKTYFAPIGVPQRQRSARRWLIVSIIILVSVLLIADLLVDKGVIKTSVRPPLQIFHNSNNQ